MTQYLIGADPELFLMNKKGSFISAHNIIPGSKHNPMPVLSGAIQPDGVAAEFNINPAKTAEEFSANIVDVLQELQSRISSSKKGLTLVVTPTATFNQTYFRKLPAHAKALGCEPDYNVWLNGLANKPPATKEPFRTGAGHIHIGWTEGMKAKDSAHLFDCHEMVKQMDATLYFCSLLWDDDEKRRTLYGKIGSFRPKHYGVEYRPLSNAWVADPDLHIWIFNATQAMAQALDAGQSIFKDYWSKTMIERADTGEVISRLAVLEYYDHLVSEYGLPKLPDAYTRVHH